MNILKNDMYLPRAIEVEAKAHSFEQEASMETYVLCMLHMLPLGGAIRSFHLGSYLQSVLVLVVDQFCYVLILCMCA